MVFDAYTSSLRAGVAAFRIGQRAAVNTSTHIAFAAKNRVTVDRFFNVAIAAGGQDHGGPGLRLQYHENDHAAFILDPDGHNIAAVCHDAVIEGN